MGVDGHGGQNGTHTAEAAVLGFYYQALFALVTLIAQTTDDAAVVVERLDDVELNVNGNTMLYQLKHSISETPPPVTLASRALWKTIKVWVDTLPVLTLSETTLWLVAVGKIPADSPLVALLEVDSDRTELLKAMQQEAQRVVDERAAAKQAGKKLPHEDRTAGCEAFLALGTTDQQNLLRRIRVQHDSPTIDKIEGIVASHLTLLPVEHRVPVARRLVEWWDRQVMYSLCGQRDRVLTRVELQHQITSFIGDIEEARLVPDFMTATPPEDYQPDGMLTRQIQLVDGGKSDLTVAIREEWRAREQRSRWLNANPAMASTINDYDIQLQEKWSDRHMQMTEQCSALEDKAKRESGLKLLRWAHQDAPGAVPPLTQGWSGHYYVSGSYQVLAIDLKVGWHPDYRDLLKEDE
jgi:hypothetical protein